MNGGIRTEESLCPSALSLLSLVEPLHRVSFLIYKTLLSFMKNKIYCKEDFPMTLKHERTFKNRLSCSRHLNQAVLKDSPKLSKHNPQI